MAAFRAHRRLVRHPSLLVFDDVAAGRDGIEKVPEDRSGKARATVSSDCDMSCGGGDKRSVGRWEVGDAYVDVVVRGVGRVGLVEFVAPAVVLAVVVGRDLEDSVRADERMPNRGSGS